MNFLFFHCKVLTHTKPLTPNSQLQASKSCVPHTQIPLCLSCTQAFLEHCRQRPAPQLLTKASCAQEQTSRSQWEIDSSHPSLFRILLSLCHYCEKVNDSCGWRTLVEGVSSQVNTKERSHLFMTLRITLGPSEFLLPLKWLLGMGLSLTPRWPPDSTEAPEQ